MRVAPQQHLNSFELAQEVDWLQGRGEEGGGIQKAGLVSHIGRGGFVQAGERMHLCCRCVAAVRTTPALCTHLNVATVGEGCQGVLDIGNAVALVCTWGDAGRKMLLTHQIAPDCCPWQLLQHAEMCCL